jgi:predicted HAD superfamily Cof-like phosphohydrolase
MSADWVDDIFNMHKKYGMHEKFDGLDRSKLRSFIQFRISFLQEELDELKKAAPTNQPYDKEEIVDALIDLCVVAIGTLDALDVDAYTAWNEVLKANMNKTPGIKESRPNPLGLPDLIKPKDWKAPSHKDNYGLMDDKNV